MSEQDIEKIMGAHYRQIQALKREIAAISAWIEGYRDAAKSVDKNLFPVLHPNSTIGAAATAPVAGIDKLAEYPAEQLRERIAELQEKRASLRDKERLLADMQ